MPAMCQRRTFRQGHKLVSTCTACMCSYPARNDVRTCAGRRPGELVKPGKVDVVCNGVHGRFNCSHQLLECLCRTCVAKVSDALVMTSHTLPSRILTPSRTYAPLASCDGCRAHSTSSACTCRRLSRDCWSWGCLHASPLLTNADRHSAKSDNVYSLPVLQHEWKHGHSNSARGKSILLLPGLPVAGHRMESIAAHMDGLYCAREKAWKRPLKPGRLTAARILAPPRPAGPSAPLRSPAQASGRSAPHGTNGGVSELVRLPALQAARDGVPVVIMTPTEFERHAGMATSKKWKHTVRVDDGSRDPPPLGAWLEARGLIRVSERWVP